MKFFNFKLNFINTSFLIVLIICNCFIFYFIYNSIIIQIFEFDIFFNKNITHESIITLEDNKIKDKIEEITDNEYVLWTGYVISCGVITYAILDVISLFFW